MSKDLFLEIHGLKKYFDAGRPGLFSRDTRHVHAVDGVDFHFTSQRSDRPGRRERLWKIHTGAFADGVGRPNCRYDYISKAVTLRT